MIPLAICTIFSLECHTQGRLLKNGEHLAAVNIRNASQSCTRASNGASKSQWKLQDTNHSAWVCPSAVSITPVTALRLHFQRLCHCPFIFLISGMHWQRHYITLTTCWEKKGEKRSRRWNPRVSHNGEERIEGSKMTGGWGKLQS